MLSKVSIEINLVNRIILTISIEIIPENASACADPALVAFV